MVDIRFLYFMFTPFSDIAKEISTMKLERDCNPIIFYVDKLFFFVNSTAKNI